MKVLKALISLFFSVLLIMALEIRWGDTIPSIAELLNPVTGFWQNIENRTTLGKTNLKLDGLTNNVIIQFDEHKIPHVFAENEHDLYFAQGYLTAQNRLWQMDIQTRSAAGRLSEIVGAKALASDRYCRRMGMVYSAEIALKEMLKDARISGMLNAYASGVNAYIHQLKKKDYPVEFKILGYKPEEWRPINSALLLKLMAASLAGTSDAAAMTNVLKKFGPAVTNDLFPDYPSNEDPVIPAATKWNFKASPLPKPSADFLASMAAPVKYKEKVEGIGSNNWALSGSKTANGYPILANDPHLNLSFPSIWYQIQLSAPGINCNGVSIPGAPAVIIGYNNKIAWGQTNVGADILDFYNIKFKDNHFDEYWYNNKWNKTTKRIEVINIRNRKPINDTVIYTHHGPVAYESPGKRPNAYSDIPVGAAVRWIAHEPSNEILTYYLLNRASSYEDYRAALTHTSAPAQNFIFASTDKDIAITVSGKFPLKFKDQGKFILNGTDPANDWQGWIPADQNPWVKNPLRGYVSSANQSSTDQTYPYFLSRNPASYERGKRINERLESMKNATIDSMRVLQTDTYSILAQNALAAMLSKISVSKLNKEQLDAYNIVTAWDKRFTAASEGASIFNFWWLEFYKGTWQDEFGKTKEVVLPSKDRTVALLLNEPDSKWFDDIQTPSKELASDIIQRSFTIAVANLIKNYGKPGSKWEWGKVKHTHINHLGKLDGFGTGNFVADGTGSVINALVDGHGPSWRMVVQVGPTVQGYGVFPGGESGNPGSLYYDDMFKIWASGKLLPLLFLQSAKEKSDRIKSTLTLSSK